MHRLIACALCGRALVHPDPADLHRVIERLHGTSDVAHRVDDQLLSLAATALHRRDDRHLHSNRLFRHEAPLHRDGHRFPGDADSGVHRRETRLRGADELLRSNNHPQGSTNNKRNDHLHTHSSLAELQRQADGQLIAAAGAVIQGLTGNPLPANPTVDLELAQPAVDALSAGSSSLRCTRSILGVPDGEPPTQNSELMTQNAKGCAWTNLQANRDIKGAALG